MKTKFAGFLRNFFRMEWSVEIHVNIRRYEVCILNLPTEIRKQELKHTHKSFWI